MTDTQPNPDTKPKRLKISLTDRPPVSIAADEWPIQGHVTDYSGEHQCQANVEAWIKIRMHDDGRMLVYAYRGSGPGGQSIGYSDWNGGYLIDADDTAAAIRAIHNLGAGIGEHCGYGSIDADRMVRDAIGSLPEERL